MRRLRACAWLLLPLLAAASVQAAIVQDLSWVDRKSDAFERFRSWVDQAVAGRPGYAFSATDAALMARLDDAPRYCKLAVDLVEQQVQAAQQRIAAGERPEVAGDSYLYAGALIGALARTFDTCGERLAPEQKQRWSAYAEQTLSNIWSPRAAEWGGKPAAWTGWGTDNPGNNYYYSFVEATMTWALASGNERWLRLLREDKLPAVVRYFSTLPGGGSREGTGYGSAQSLMFALFTLWRENTGEDLAAGNPHVADSIAYWVHATMPTLDRHAPIGDQARVSEPVLYDHQRRFMLQARQATDDSSARALASWWLHHISVQRMEHGFNARHDLLPAGDGGTRPAVLLHHARGVGHLFARSSWERDAMWLGFVAGPFEESHAHQDQGAFTLYANGWLAVSENIWTHSGIQQDTDVQNVLRFEHEGRIVPQWRSPKRSTLVIETAADGGVLARADLAAAYRDDSPIRQWQRELRFSERRLLVHDRWQAGSGTQAIFQINVPDKPVIGDGEARAGRLRIRVLAPADAQIESVDFSRRDAQEFKRGWRVDIRGSGNEYRVELAETAPAAAPQQASR